MLKLESRADFFEQDAAHELARLLRGAAQYSLAFAAQHHHAALRRWTEWSDEVWSATHLAVELLFLTRRGAALGDALCGLRRTGHDGVRGGGAAWWRLLLYAVVRVAAPYVEARLLRDEERRQAPEQKLHWRSVLRRMGQFAALMLRISYAFNERQTAFSLADLVSGTVAVRVAASEAAALELQRSAARSARLATISLARPLRSAAALAAQASLDAFDSAAALVAPAVTAYRFVEWWFANESALLAGSQFVPPAPPLDVLDDVDAAALLADSQLCPLCRGARRNPAVALTSGIVYCYKCLLEHVREHGECPVSRRPLQARQIVRVF